MSSTTCRRCGRELTKKESVERGYGLVCWNIIQRNHALEDYPEKAEEQQTRDDALQEQMDDLRSEEVES